MTEKEREKRKEERERRKGREQGKENGRDREGKMILFFLLRSVLGKNISII